jgi:hypothetical protein
MSWPAMLFLAAVAFAAPAAAQQKTAKPESLARLDLSVETATTDDEGYPSALRITIRNVGGVAVDMPVLKEDCSPDNGFHIQSSWQPDTDTGLGIGRGYGCGVGDGPALMYRIQHDWVRLRPGEFMTVTKRVGWSDYGKDGPGTVDYLVEYTPPSVTEQELASLSRAGYVIPDEKLQTPLVSFHMR